MSIARICIETGSWQYCESCDVDVGKIMPRMMRGETPTVCHCGKTRAIVEVYMCSNDSCLRGARKVKKMKKDEVSFPCCHQCGDNLVQDSTFRILPA